MTFFESLDGELAVATQQLSKRFERQTALEGIALQVPDGAVYLLAGVNGAGKSTLFKLLMNLERPDSGTAQLCGLDTASDGPAVRARVGYVPDRPEAPYRWMKCTELLRHVSAFYPAWDHGYAERLSHALGVRAEAKVGGLSKGEAQRLQLVLALAHRPPVLLLDEPTDGLDPVVRRRAMTILAEHLADSPTTVVISTHHIGEIESLVDHVGVLRHGRLVAQSSREALQRTVRAYDLEIPAGWTPPEALHVAALQRSSTGRDARCTIVGAEAEVLQRLAGSGAQVRGSSVLGLEDAVLAFLPDHPSEPAPEHRS